MERKEQNSDPYLRREIRPLTKPKPRARSPKPRATREILPTKVIFDAVVSQKMGTMPLTELTTAVVKPVTIAPS